MKLPNLRQTRFSNAKFNSLGVELLSLDRLRSRVKSSTFFEPERVEFFMLLIPTSGSGKHIIDFEKIDLYPGKAIFVQPCQIQQWQEQVELTADVILIDPVIIPTHSGEQAHVTMNLLRLNDWPHWFEIAHEDMLTWNTISTLLQQELIKPLKSAISKAMTRELLLCLLLHISKSATKNLPFRKPEEQLIHLFRKAINERITSRPSVQVLADQLGLSTSKLNRICSDVLGHSAKHEVDLAVTMEAKRILIHSSITSVEIAAQLGFDETTNFIKFFKRVERTTPEAFRRQYYLSAAETPVK